ncbi:MAG: serine/threonine protein kinase, partial [Lentisphaeria bacterium]|nr:serine/threonine protein kinase [Lentisphaeria bacterium]
MIDTPVSRVAPGAIIADFIIQKELGRGGMGVVYLAHQISLDRPSALKVLSENYANDAQFVGNFIKEARAAAKLNHPHIVQAYAVGEDEGIFYFAMEDIDGKTMKEVLKEQQLIPADQALLIVQQIAEALDYAWREQKLIHRDIKPDNIMLTNSGRAKL